MPWIVPSHQAPVLPLKIWRPAAFSGLCLVLGSMAPDLAFMLPLQRDSSFSHTVLAQLTFTVVFSLLLHRLLTGLVFPFLVTLLPPGPPWHFESLAALRPLRTRRELLKGALSAGLGGVTHVLLDGFTHDVQHAGWAVAYLPILSRPVPHFFGSAPLHDALQVWLSLLLGLGAVRTWQRLGREGRLFAWRGEVSRLSPPASAVVKRRTLRFVGAMVLAGGFATPIARGAADPQAVLEFAVYGSIAFLFYGLVAVALWDRFLRSLGFRRWLQLRPLLRGLREAT